MKSSKNLWTIILMTSSMVLLLVLQVLWLRSAYQDELDSLEKEANNLFRSTVLAMHDSLVLKSIEPVMVRGDSIQKLSADSIRMERLEARGPRIPRDSLRFKTLPRGRGLSRFEFRDSSQIQIYVSSVTNGDSVRQILRPIISEFRKNRQPGNFVFRIGNDSLKIADIQKNYHEALIKSGITIPPIVERLESFGKPDVKSAGGFSTEPFFLPHMPVYIARFENIKTTLLAQISQQILFSLVVTLLTLTAFFFMYRSILSQQKLMALKNDLISNITHELKTPVATVSVALEALKKFNALDNPQLTREYLEIAQNELGRLSLMTDKILKTSIFEENGVELKLEPVDLEKIIDQVLASLKLMFEKHKAHVSFLKEGEDFLVNGSREHLTNVVYNLLDNAIKYSQPGCGLVIRLKKDNDKIELSVKDDGIGIPQEFQKKVFEKFFRVPTGDIHNAKGYGLGLNYVASIVKHHGGGIRLESGPGKGSIFTITLPI